MEERPLPQNTSPEAEAMRQEEVKETRTDNTKGITLPKLSIKPKTDNGRPKINKTILKILLLLVLVSIFAGLLSYLGKSGNIAPLIETITSINEEEELPEILPPEPVVEPDFKTYVNDLHSFSFEYAKEATIEVKTPFSDDPIQYRAIHTGPRQEGEVDLESDLEEGYIFRVSVHENIDSTIDELSSRKREKYILDCPNITRVEDVKGDLVDGVEAKTFEVINCPQNYKHTFLSKYGKIYEIVRVYIGDLGFRQAYETKTDEILRSFKFLIDETVVTTEEVYENPTYHFKLVHPKLNTTCCSVTEPPEGQFETLIVLANVDKSVDKTDESFDGLGILVDPNKEGLSYDRYVNDQKQSLIQEYRVIVGKNPSPEEKIINIGGVDGLLLKGYAWWGDVIYLPVPGSQAVLVIVKSEVKDGSFDKGFNEILDTFEFFNPES